MSRLERRVKSATGTTLTLEAQLTPRWKGENGLQNTDPAEERAIGEAYAAFQQSRLDDLKLLLAPFVAAPTLSSTLTLLARAHVVEGDFAAAEVLLKRAEQQFPQDPQVWNALAIVHRLQGRPVEELVYRRHMVLLLPKPAPGAYFAFAQAYATAYWQHDDPPLGEVSFVGTKLQERPLTDDAVRRERLEFAEQLYRVRALQIPAIQHYRTVSPLPAGERDVSVAWLPLQQWCARSGAPCERGHHLGRPGRRPTLARLSRIAVMPTLQWAPLVDEEKVAIDGFMTHRVRLRTEQPDSPLLLYRDGHRAEIRMPRELPLVEQPALLLGGEPQYYHQTIDYLGGLAVAETLGAPSDLPIVVNDDLAPFQREQFALLGIDEGRLIRVRRDEPLRFADLWVPSRPVEPGQWIDPLLPQWLRQRLVRQPGPARRKLYLSRAGTGRRRVVNEAEVLALLAALGYEEVHCDHLGVAQQVELFAQASHLVAPTGAALTNMVYAPPGCSVVSFYNRVSVAGGMALYFDALARACGHEFAQVDCKPVGVNEVERPADADIEVDLPSLRAALDAA